MFALVLAAWGRAAPATPLGATRVVSLSPVATRIVLALGHAGRLVAVDPASARLPGLHHLPVTDGPSSGVFSPDLLLVPADEALPARRAAPSAGILEVVAHDFDEAWELHLAIGAALGSAEEARRYVREVSRPLAELSAASFGKRRPRVVAVLSLDPLEIAGGHSFLTDLIEMAGGENVSHGTEEPRLAWSPAEIARTAPELALLVGEGAPGAPERSLARHLLGPGVRIEVLILAEHFWLDDPLPALERVRAWLEALRADRPQG